MLKAINIHFCIRQRPIVELAEISLQAGELLAVLGPNGAGKSTLLKILSGETSCKRGAIQYNGVSIMDLSTKALARIRAVMPQHSTLSFPYKATEVVELGLASQTTNSPDKLLREVMTETQTWELRDRQYGKLSGGEKQRVQLARVLIQIWEMKPYPRYLLLDEPTSSMDIGQQHHVLQIVSRLKKRNIGILAIVHDLNLAAAYADNVALLRDGVICYQGETASVMTAENLEKTFDHPVKVVKDPDNDQLLIISQVQTKRINHEFKRA
jgi:iron complex transport system ATP-binding protein